MRKHFTFKLSILFFSIILLSSCGYTNKTGSSKQFSKKHYNRGIVKHKSVAKKDSEKIALNEGNTKEKQSKKEALKEQLVAYMESKDLTTSNSSELITDERNTVKDVIENNFAQTKEELNERKGNASSEKEKKQLDKKIGKLDKFENLLSKFSIKVEEKMAAAPNAPIATKASNNGTVGLLSGIFGITGFVLAFIPYIWFLGLLLCISAIVLGAIGLKGSRRGWAIAGLVLGTLGVLFFLLSILVLFAIFI